jgi:hypothetical protein
MTQHFDAAARRYRIRSAGVLAGRISASMLLLLFSLGFFFVIALQACRFFQLDDAGYGDSYILYDILHFQRTGVIYRDLTLPPYLPAQYSPFMYMLYSLPKGMTANPFSGPRLISLASFVLCVAMTVSLVRALIPVRIAWL